MHPTITTIAGKKCVGIHVATSLTDNKTSQLWKTFMQRRGEVINTAGSNLISLQVYNDEYFAHFNPSATFEKWALIQVTDLKNIPPGFESFLIPAGVYAVFNYEGHPAKGADFFQKIFNIWLPEAGYHVDQRPHFEVLGEHYKNDSDDSREEIWIPIK